MKIKKYLSAITKSSLVVAALGFMAGCVYDPYPAGGYYASPSAYRCYSYPNRCYYSSQYYYYGNSSYYRSSSPYYYGNRGYSYVY